MKGFFLIWSEKSAAIALALFHDLIQTSQLYSKLDFSPLSCSSCRCDWSAHAYSSTAAGAQLCVKEQQEAVIAQLAVVSDWASQESATVWMCALLSACHCCFPKPRCALALLSFFFKSIHVLQKTLMASRRIKKEFRGLKFIFLLDVLL